jgi:hypothetical protein
MRHLRITLGLTVLALLAVSALARAQAPMTVSIGFAFKNGTMQMPAGKYMIRQEAGVEVALKQVDGAAATVVPVLTYLGRHDNDQFPELVFDILPDGPHLAEVWFPGFDGYLVLSTRESHQHRVIQAK